jgi:hypothetical protein
MMDEKDVGIAYCGLNCDECPVFLATSVDDDAARTQVAEEWSKKFQWNLAPSDINCDGCKTMGGRTFGYCRECRIRECGSERGIDNCALCEEYACLKIQGFFSFSSAARAALEAIRNGRPG